MFTADHDHELSDIRVRRMLGRGIAEGIVYEYDGQEPPQEQHDKLPSQIERVKELLCPKPEGCAAKRS